MLLLKVSRGGLAARAGRRIGRIAPAPVIVDDSSAQLKTHTYTTARFKRIAGKAKMAQSPSFPPPPRTYRTWASMVRLISIIGLLLAVQFLSSGQTHADMLAVCVSDSPANHRCPLNQVWVNCHSSGSARISKEDVARSLCVVNKPDGTQAITSFSVVSGQEGRGGLCGWLQLFVTCASP
jgi:hypothetical protein